MSLIISYIDRPKIVQKLYSWPPKEIALIFVFSEVIFNLQYIRSFLQRFHDLFWSTKRN